MAHKNLVVGSSTLVQLNNGQTVPSVFLDGASSKPMFTSILQMVNEYAPMYTAVNGGHSKNSLYAEYEFEKTREDILDFVKADKKNNVTVFVQNTTEGVNKLSYILSQKYPNAVVLTTVMEHHSNILPWSNNYDHLLRKMRFGDLKSILGCVVCSRRQEFHGNFC